MSIDAILSQVTGGLNWSSLSWEILLRALLILLVGIIFNKLLLRTVDRLLLRSASLAPIQRYLRSALSVLLWLVLILVVLGSVGVEMTSIIALLSVAGLAVSLALQNTLSNLAGGITLLASKPFTVGDYVEIGSVSGTVSLDWPIPRWSPWKTRRSTSPTASSPPPPLSTTPGWAAGGWRSRSPPPMTRPQMR